MSYKISEYTKGKAKSLGVVVKPSTRKGKKIDVFKNGIKLASIGAIGYSDFPTYLKLEIRGEVKKGEAERRRKLYKVRHEQDRRKVGTAGWFADNLLW